MILFSGAPNCEDHNSSDQATCEGTIGCVWTDTDSTCGSATYHFNTVTFGNVLTWHPNVESSCRDTSPYEMIHEVNPPHLN